MNQELRKERQRQMPETHPCRPEGSRAAGRAPSGEALRSRQLLAVSCLLCWLRLSFVWIFLPLLENLLTWNILGKLHLLPLLKRVGHSLLCALSTLAKFFHRNVCLSLALKPEDCHGQACILHAQHSACHTTDIELAGYTKRGCL